MPTSGKQAPTTHDKEKPAPEPISAKLTDPVPVAIVGMSLWLIGLVILVVARLWFHADNMPWIWTCLAGLALGAVGYGIFRWQRSAARRGVKGAQKGLL